MTIATTSGRNPWVTPVFFAYDGKGDFYWGSPKDALHSNNIAKNPNVAITIFNSTEPSETVDGLYVKAKAKQARGKELLKGIALLAKKGLEKNMVLKTDFLGRSPLRVYSAHATQMWLLGEEKFYHGQYVDGRVEVI